MHIRKLSKAEFFSNEYENRCIFQSKAPRSESLTNGSIILERRGGYRSVLTIPTANSVQN